MSESFSGGWRDESSRLVDAGDLDALTRHVDRLCHEGDWPGLVDLRDRCRQALHRGRQLWPVASHIEYRVALEAPGCWAAAMLEEGTGRFALGPLPEVAASTHPWAELAGHVPATPAATMAAHERVVRGEDLRHDPVVASLPSVLDLPFALEPWEPRYPLADYHPDRAETDAPVLPPCRDVPVDRPPVVRAVEDSDAVTALRDLALAWTTESDGRAEATAVQGSATAAVAALGARSVRLTEIEPAQALALMAWVAASGGAHGRRRGAAVGRFAAWWAISALGGLLDEWPVPPEDIGEVLLALRWFRWDAGEPERGWVLRLAVEDLDERLAWAVAATDSA